MTRITAIFSGLFLVSCITPELVSGSLIPSSITIRSGYVTAAATENGTHPASVALSSTWDLGTQTALWSSVGYIQEKTVNSILLRFIPSPPLFPVPYNQVARTHLVPMSVGLRAYANDTSRRSRGLFVEGGPAAYIASYRGTDQAKHLAALGGLQCGLGVRFAGIDGSRVELGGNYYLAEAFGQHQGAIGRVGTTHEVDYNLFSLYLALGFGD